MTSHGQWVARTPRGRVVASGETLHEVVLEFLYRPPARRVTVRWEGEPEPCLVGPLDPPTPIRLEKPPPPLVDFFMRETSLLPPDVSPKATTG